mmetsp:Transcript_11041/g.18467  ORF Transcript_11041/g.18467 Transcript_11041/m.18467 type:complete len:95 (-) Transcript_11041:440-724(-)
MKGHLEHNLRVPYDQIDISLRSRISVLEEREKVEEDEFQCKYCTDLCYFSFVICTNHSDSFKTDQILQLQDPEQDRTPGNSQVSTCSQPNSQIK